MRDDFAEAWRRRVRPDNEIPVTVRTAVMLGRTDELAVAMSDLWVFSTGVEFTVTARCRGALARRGTEIFAGLGGRRDPRNDFAVEPLLLRFEFSDGRSVSNATEWPPSPPDPAHGPWLTTASGAGSNRSFDQDFFLTPLPPGDSLTMIAAWPGFDIDETRHVIDAVKIRAAAAQVIELWPEEPYDFDES